MLKNRFTPAKIKTLLRRVALPAIVLGVLYSCASIGRLEGGPIDETPPRFLTSTPLPGQLHVNKNKVSIEFDEYIKLEKPGEKIVISPPQVQQPEVKASSKKVIVELLDTLKANTTYTIDFGDAVQDNNEGNPLQGFTFTFSTGDRLDTMAVAGTVLNASNLEPVKGILVGLYANLEDSAFTTLPLERVGRTDSRGQFSIRGVAPGKYHIFALQDADQNFAFTQPAEVIAFHDSLIIPSQEQRIRQDTTWLDSLTVDTIVEREYTYYLPDDIMLRCFKEKHFAQRLAKSERPVPNQFSLYFTAPADSLPLIKGLNFDEREAFLVEQTTGRNDTLHYWIKDSLIYKIDTLQMSLSYLYTDSLKQLVPRTDTLKLVSKQRPKTEKELEREAKEREKKEKEREKKRAKGEKVEEEPTIKFLPVDVYAPGTIDVYDYLSLTFSEPIAAFDTAGIHLQHKVDTLWEEIPFDIQRDSLDLKLYNIYADWLPDNSYAFLVDSTAFHGIYGLFTDKIKKEFKAKKLEDYGAIFFDVSNALPTAYVELLDAQDKVVRTVPLTNGKADFYFLNPGKYGARLVNDRNGNGTWDTGRYADKLQPEEVYYYPQILELKANFELNQTWDVLELPLDKQKPNDMKKQKPEEDKKKKRNNSSSGNRNSGNSRY
ncbi:MAG: Ig-like domain-containing protein [Bacteroides sp.]|nr:Ig-like domain-containing protein [Bacteroides sp.]